MASGDDHKFMNGEHLLKRLFYMTLGGVIVFMVAVLIYAF